jgi:basic membrane protein A
MKRRDLLYGLGAAGSAIVLNNCAFAPSTPQRSRRAALFKVAMLLPRGADSDDWCREGMTGLGRIERELNAEIAYTDDINKGLPASLPQALDRYAKEGFGFIIGHSGTFRDDMVKAAVRYPRTRFAIVASDSGNNRNFGALGYRNSELGYLLGATLALQPKLQHIGLVTSLPTPPIKQFNLAFQNALRRFAPDRKLSIEWVGSFDDEPKAIALTQKLIGAGIDGLAMNCWTNNPAIVNVAVDRQLPMAVLGPDSRKLAPNLILASGLIHVPELILHGARLAQRGRWEGRQYLFGLSERVLEFIPTIGNLNPESQKEIVDLHDQIRSGRLEVLEER